VRLVVQRVSRAEVRVDGKVTGQIDGGLVVLLGLARNDTLQALGTAAEKTANLRIFPDEAGRMNRSALETGGAVLLVSQFTLAGDTRKGRRPNFENAMPPEEASPMVQRFAGLLAEAGLHVEQGIFGAHMDVELVNDGPVTIVLDF
jgi:D-tyrosyl-tRNA(Tyr) deacylase